MTSVIAVLASAGVTIGMALQGALGNLAGGIMLLIFRPFNVGEYISAAGAAGTVREITLLYTILTTPDGRKVKGTIHWVEASHAGAATVRLYENIVDEEKGVYNKEDGSLNLNPNSLTTVTAYVEPALMEAKGYDSFQFVRNGFFCADVHDSKEGQPVFNRIVSLKSSFTLPKA